MIYGNTGAGLVDVDVPQSPLYQQALPNLRDVSAAAWGLPSLDDISVPDVTTEKDIQTDTDLTQKYFDLATKLKNYAVKGRSVGIDVTKPKNNPTHLQFSQEWNKMYQEFLQTGKELKNAKANIGVYNKAVTNPNAIVAPLEKGQVVTDDYLNQRSIETPFSNAKMLVKGYQSLKPIFDQNTFTQFQDKWIGDMDMIDQESEQMKAQKPELADQIDAYAEQVKAQMFPPQMDYALKAKLAQAYKIHKDNLAPKWYNAQTAREGLEFRKSQQEVARGQFAEKVQQLMNNGGTTENGFGKIVPDNFGKPQFIPRKVVAKKASEIKSNLQVAGGTPNPNDVLFIVQEEGGIKTYNMSNPQQQQQFALDYEAGNAFLENQLKQQQGIFDFSVNPDDNLYNVEPLFDATQVGKNKTNTQSEKGTKSTTKKTTAPVKTFKGVPQGGF
jgi:predicted HicB family RNase H-like nuclease